MSRKIDHLVYAVPNLEEAMDWLEDRLGIRPVFGGRHAKQGTKNALLHLGKECYLELLAVDSNNTSITEGRWMGMDLIQEAQFTRWAIHSKDLSTDSTVLKTYHPQMAEVQAGQRTMPNGQILQWELIMPLAKPKVEIVPFCIDWQHSAVHPSHKLVPQCRLVDLQLFHPNPPVVRPLFDALALGQTIQYGESVQIKARIQGVKGIVKL